MTKWPINKSNRFLIATDRDSMNVSDWEVFITDIVDKTSSEETSNVEVSEIIVDVEDVNGAIASDSAAGTRIIHLDSDEGAKFKVGDKIKIPTVNGDDYREIKSISGDDIVIYRKLTADVKADTDDDGENDNKITLVGNTGDYVVKVTSSDLSTPLESGKDYQVMVQSRSLQMDMKSEVFHVTPYDVDELGSDLDEIKDKIDELSGKSTASGRIFI